MSSACSPRLPAMNELTRTPTTLSNIGVAMFAVADQDAALAFYTDKLGFEVRGDTRFGEHNEMRWLEVAPPESRARLALNPPMGGQPGCSSIGVETADVLGEAPPQQAGARFCGDVTIDKGGKQVLLQDPAGNLLDRGLQVLAQGLHRCRSSRRRLHLAADEVEHRRLRGAAEQ